MSEPESAPCYIRHVSTARQPRVLIALAIAVVISACGGESQPESFREGRTIYGDLCSVCHGSSGEGQVGPAIAGVVATWPQCSDQIEWIRLGSDGWRAEYGDTYGATQKPITGGMPAHGDSLSTPQIRAVAAFERAQYGGREVETALRECGAE